MKWPSLRYFCNLLMCYLITLVEGNRGCWMPNDESYFLYCIMVLKSGPDRMVRPEKPWTSHNHGFLCSRTGLYPKSRKPFESRFNRTVLRTVIRPLLTVPFESEPSKKKKKKTQKNKRKRNTTPSPEKHRNTTPSPKKHRNKTPSQKKKKKYIMSAIAISRETQHVFMFLLLLSSGHITQLPLFRNSSLGRSKL